MNEPMPGDEREPESARVPEGEALPEDVPGPEDFRGAEDVSEPVGGPEPGPSADSGPLPLGVARTRTGHAEVDARLERLADADQLPTDGHIEVYEDVHRGLRDELTALDARPGPPPPTHHP